jgi:hypothetical protein
MSEGEAVDRDALWKSVVFEAGCWALDRMSCEDAEPGEVPAGTLTTSAAARAGAWFVWGLWAHLVWRHDLARRAQRGGPTRYYGPGSFGEVVVGPGGTAVEAEEVRAAAWRDAVEFGFVALFGDDEKSRSPARRRENFA